MLGVFGGVSCRAGTAGRELPLQRRRAASGLFCGGTSPAGRGHGCRSRHRMRGGCAGLSAGKAPLARRGRGASFSSCGSRPPQCLPPRHGEALFGGAGRCRLPRDPSQRKGGFFFGKRSPRPFSAGDVQPAVEKSGGGAASAFRAAPHRALRHGKDVPGFFPGGGYAAGAGRSACRGERCGTHGRAAFLPAAAPACGEAAVRVHQRRRARGLRAAWCAQERPRGPSRGKKDASGKRTPLPAEGAFSERFSVPTR